MKEKEYLYILIAGILWGTQGVLGKSLNQDLTSMQVAFCRVFFGFIFMFAFIAIKYPQKLKIDKKGLLFTAIQGLICQSINNICFFYSISKTSVSTATTLLYTAPIFGMVISRFVFNEKITKLKLIALSTCIIGCFYTVTSGDINSLSGSSMGIMAGLCAGLAYSLISIIGKKLIGRYDSWTILVYCFGFGWIFMSPLCNPIGILTSSVGMMTWINIMLIGLIPTFFAFMFYFKGISEGAQPSKVGIVATIELVISVVLACLIFSEPLGMIRIGGIGGILFSVYLIYLDNLKSKEKDIEENMHTLSES